MPFELYIPISNTLSIPYQEITFIASRSSGPGGQHVNKVSSRITLQFNVKESPSLNDMQRELILNALKNRINSEGVLQVHSQANRSQLANKEAAVKRFVEILKKALQRKPARKKTKIPRAAHENRLSKKKQKSSIKKIRSNKSFNMD